MKLAGWIGIYVAALLTEVAALPRFLGSTVLALTAPALLLGVSYQRFWPGFVFAALVGVLRDVVAGGGVHTLSVVGAFFAMHAFRSLAPWEEPASRIGMVAIGLAALPVSSRLAAEITGSFGAADAGADWAGLFGAGVPAEALFALAWFAVFSWVEIRRTSRRRERWLRQV